MFIAGSVYCQAQTVDEDSLTTVISTIAFSEIPDEFTKLSNRLIEVTEFILPKEKVLNDDTIVTEYSAMLEQRKEEIVATLPLMTNPSLENNTRAWYNFDKQLNVIQEVLKKRIHDIESLSDELNKEKQRWE